MYGIKNIKHSQTQATTQITVTSETANVILHKSQTQGQNSTIHQIGPYYYLSLRIKYHTSYLCLTNVASEWDEGRLKPFLATASRYLWM